jgi:BASS family bile acid:Na+ symporter
LAWLGRHATGVIAAGVFLGLIVPPLAAALRPFLLPAIVLPFVVALLRLDRAALLADLRRPLLPGLAVAWALLGSPLLVAALAAPLPGPLAAALVATAACPPLMASGALALLLGLEAGLAVLVTVAATALAPLAVPPVALHLAGLALELDALALTLRLLLLVTASFAAARLLRCLVGAARLERHAEPLSGLAALGLVAFACGIMRDIPAYATRAPGYVAACLLLATLLNAGLQALTAALFHRLPRARALTLGLCAGNNNLGLVVAAIAERAPEGLVVWLAMAQLPIYLLPLVQRPLYRRLLGPRSGPT